MRKDFLPKLFFIIIASFLIAGCSWLAPGMHMYSGRLTESLNKHDQIVHPHIYSITAHYLREQKIHDALKIKWQRSNYKKPAGFSTNKKLYRYRVGPNDILQIIIWNQDEKFHQVGASYSNAAMNSSIGAAGNASYLNNNNAQSADNYVVDSDGKIFYPFIGYFYVEGKTLQQIRYVLSRKLTKYVKNPQITVNVLSFNSKSVVVTGSVNKPTIIPITTNPLDVLSAVTEAGGAIRCGAQLQSGGGAQCADLSDVDIKRGGKNIRVNLIKLHAIDGSSTNWILKGGDIVYVPSNNDKRVFVLGAINSPGPYTMVDGEMTLREAIGDAKGVSTAANSAYTYVIRDYKNNPKLFVLDLSSADALNLAGEFNLMPGDVVFVSSSALSNFNEILNQVTPTLFTAVSIKSLTH